MTHAHMHAPLLSDTSTHAYAQASALLEHPCAVDAPQRVCLACPVLSKIMQISHRTAACTSECLSIFIHTDINTYTYKYDK